MGSGAPKQSTSQRTGTRWLKADVSSAQDEMRTERDRIQQEMLTKLWACNPKVVVTAGRCLADHHDSTATIVTRGRYRCNKLITGNQYQTRSCAPPERLESTNIQC